MTVPVEKVYGTYVASYPFGTETITLNRDGTFVQQVAIRPEQPVTVHGTWDFDAKESRANFYGAMVVTSPFGHLSKDWRTVTGGIVSLDVEKHWFRFVMGSALPYPYVKEH
jgi:maltose-binding protein MalE